MRFSRFKQQMEGLPTQPRRARPVAPRPKKSKPNKPSTQTTPYQSTEEAGDAKVKGEVKPEPEMSGMELLIKAEAQEAGEAMEGVERHVKAEPQIKAELATDQVSFIKPESTVKAEPKDEEDAGLSLEKMDASPEATSMNHQSPVFNTPTSTVPAPIAATSRAPSFTPAPSTWAKFDAGIPVNPVSPAPIIREEPPQMLPSRVSPGLDAAKPEPFANLEPVVKIEPRSEM